MGPLRMLLGIVIAVVSTVVIYAVAGLLENFVDQIYMYIYGTPFNWNYLPPPISTTMRQIYELVLPNWFLIVLVLIIVSEFVLMFRKTNEGVVIWQ